MREPLAVPRLALATSLILVTACATSRPLYPVSEPEQEPAPLVNPQESTPGEDPPPQAEAPALATPGPEDEAPEAGFAWVQSPPVLIHALSSGQLQFSFPVLPLHPDMERLSVDDIHSLLRALYPRPKGRLRLRLPEEMRAATDLSRGPFAPWEFQLHKDFLSLYGPPRLPLALDESLETNRLVLALKLSTRYMDDGIREAAEELFLSPVFVASVALSITVYFAAWLAPEPFFSKGFAAALTVRLALLVGIMELSRLAHACIRLYQEVEAASSHEQLEAASARFGKTMGGVFLRTIVVVASFGLPHVISKVPQGSLMTLLSPLRHAPEGGAALESITSAQIVADSTLVVSGVAAGTSAASICGELAACAVASGSGGSTLSTRYGKPHTRQNPPHNEAIEQELARREAAGHTGLRKNQPQQDASGGPAFDHRAASRIRFRKPDVSSVRPDGVRHNTNYVSNTRDMKRELDAFDAMVEADKAAIHELYLLDGTLVRRFVPPGVSFP
jgi:hypothetical protein